MYLYLMPFFFFWEFTTNVPRVPWKYNRNKSSERPRSCDSQYHHHNFITKTPGLVHQVGRLGVNGLVRVKILLMRHLHHKHLARRESPTLRVTEGSTSRVRCCWKIMRSALRVRIFWRRSLTNRADVKSCNTHTWDMTAHLSPPACSELGRDLMPVVSTDLQSGCLQSTSSYLLTIQGLTMSVDVWSPQIDYYLLYMYS